MFLRAFGKIGLKIFGWKVEGKMPDLKKCVVIAAPHTSNFDFVFGVLYAFSQGLNVKFLIKKEAFFFPMKYLLNSLGGIPVDRKKNTNVVEQVSEKIKKSKKFVLVLAPEGTRKKTKKWRSGFFYIAKTADIPIVVAYLDYQKKIVGFKNIIKADREFDEQINEIKKLYKGIVPKYPEMFTLEEQ